MILLYKVLWLVALALQAYVLLEVVPFAVGPVHAGLWLLVCVGTIPVLTHSPAPRA